MEQAAIYDLADDLAKYILDYAKRHGVQATISTCCCGELELQYRDPNGSWFVAATVDIDPLEGDVK